MSDPPEKKHPWSKYYAERGVARPSLAHLKRQPEPGAPASKQRDDARGNKQQPELSAELQAAVAAMTGTVPGTTAAPFITALQKEAVARELRRLARIRLAKIGVTVVAGLIVVHLAVTRVFYRAPSDEALETHVQSLAGIVVLLYSSVQQPLQSGPVAVAMTDRIDANHFRYTATVTLELRKPLYVPAVTNGTVDYRQLQESLQAARDKELKFNLFPPNQGPQPPELPLLLQQSHRPGETILVRVPFYANRFGWQWRLELPLVALRAVNRTLDGDSIERFAVAPYLIFGEQGTLAGIRERKKAAKDYIVAVTKEVQKRADGEAVVEMPGPDQNQPNPIPVDVEATGKPAVPDEFAPPAEKRPLFVDPNAPAVQPGEAPRPAVDPNAPAVQSGKEPRPAVDQNASMIRFRSGETVTAPKGGLEGPAARQLGLTRIFRTAASAGNQRAEQRLG